MNKREIFRIVKHKYFYVFLLTFLFLILFFINFKINNIWIGGDNLPIFYSNGFILKQLFTWSHQSGFGGVGMDSANFLLLPIILAIRSLNYFINYSIINYIYNLLIFLSLPLSFYYFLGIFSKNNLNKFCLTIFISLNFLTWFAIERNIIFLTFFFILTPLLLRIIYDIIINNKNRYYLLFLLSFLNSILFYNPWTVAIQALIFLIFLLNIIINSQNKWILIKKILLSFLFLYSFSIIGIFSNLIFYKTNSSLTTDSWNQILIQSQKNTSNLSNSFRGFNGDIFAYWGYYNDKLFYPFPYAQQYKITFFTFISFIPILLFAFYFLIKKSKNKNGYYFLFVYLIFLLFFKADAEPFGFVFSWLMAKIPLFSIFRNPQQKISLLLLLCQSVIILFLFDYLDEKRFKKLKILLITLLFVYSVAMGFYYFTGDFIPKNDIVTSIPEEYKIVATYINNDNSIKRIMPLPYNESTWLNTTFNYEGYNLFSYLLPEKQIYNRNNGAFSQYNSLFMTKIGDDIQNHKKNLYIDMQSLNIDTIIYEGFVDEADRFKVNEDQQKNINYLNNQKNLYLDKDFGEIKIYRLNKSFIKSYINSNNLSFQKINPIKYKLYIKDIKNNQDLSFLESFDNNWHLYLNQNPKYSWCQKLQLYNNNGNSVVECQSNQRFFEGEELSYLYKKSIFDDTHKLVNDYANQWAIDPEYIKNNFDKSYYKENPDGSIDIELTLYFKPQSYFYVGLIISGTTLVGCLGYLGWDLVRRRKRRKEIK
jgi:hypothetical protein